MAEDEARAEERSGKSAVSGMLTSAASEGSQEYREEIRQTIEALRGQLVGRTLDRSTIESNLNLMRMKEEARAAENIGRIEKQLWSIAVDIQDPADHKQRMIVGIAVFYTLLTFACFIALTFSNTVLLPSFNIPYSVLLMGMVGSLVSLYARLSRVRKSSSIEKDQVVWFITNPPIAVIMSGIFFGMVQIVLPAIHVQLLDESWFFWILAWLVGLNNWVFLFEKFSAFGDRGATEQAGRPSKAAVFKREMVRHEVVRETSEQSPTAE